MAETSISQEVQGLNDVPSNDQPHKSGKEAAKQHVGVRDSAIEVPAIGGLQMSVEDSGKANNAAAHAEHGILPTETQFCMKGLTWREDIRQRWTLKYSVGKMRYHPYKRTSKRWTLQMWFKYKEHVHVDVEEHEIEATCLSSIEEQCSFY
uniref:uncharacterized protein LOC122598586 n=1 Tax=Erigeron canadensis TaxID=72917 RepID=UPI001CB89E87|nr:uncharacterized protein LOC122598586 [Erigeron canadensis]XP_043627116.1 uncharacterized protein LOC122598586 [Erigeron canadensis]